MDHHHVPRRCGERLSWRRLEESAREAARSFAGLAQRARRTAAARLRNIRDYDLPDAATYDRVADGLFAGYFSQIADELARELPAGPVLEVGGGPGQLAVLLAAGAPSIALTGVDISADMLAIAARRTTTAGLRRQASFVVGDVGMLPFPSERFEAVISIDSLHHWPDPVAGLSEIFRILVPGGEARIYDPAHCRFWRALGRDRLAELVRASTFKGGAIETYRWPGRLPLFVQLRLRRPHSDATT